MNHERLLAQGPVDVVVGRLLDDLRTEADLCRNETVDELGKLLDDAADAIEYFRDAADNGGGNFEDECERHHKTREELQQARHDLMVRATVKDERIDTLDAAGHRLALELECLLLDTKDLPTVSRWWESGMEALEEWQRLFPYNGPKLGD